MSKKLIEFQTEIFQNMTKGEWIANGHYLLLGDKAGRVIFEANVDVEEDKKVTQQNNERALIDVQAVAILKRETIDKGINPESVEAAIDKLHQIIEAHEDGRPLGHLISDAKTIVYHADLNNTL